MRCDLNLFFSQPFKCLMPGHSADCLGDPVKCRFTSRIPDFMQNFLSLCLSCRRWSKPGSSLLISKNVSLRVDSLYAKATEAVIFLAAFSASSTVSMWNRWEINSEARNRFSSERSLTIRLVPPRKRTTSPLHISAGKCLGKQISFAMKTKQNTLINCV